ALAAISTSMPARCRPSWVPWRRTRPARQSPLTPGELRRTADGLGVVRVVPSTRDVTGLIRHGAGGAPVARDLVVGPQRKDVRDIDHVLCRCAGRGDQVELVRAIVPSAR